MTLDFSLEESNWRDEGCPLFPRCLACPLEKCVEELPRGRQKLLLGRRDRDIALMREQGKDPAEIARIFAVSTRTVRRAVRRDRNAS